MGLRLASRAPPLTHAEEQAQTRSALDQPSHSSSHTRHRPAIGRVHPSWMVTHYNQANLIELNHQSEDSCLVIVSEKVYDLTLWLDEQEQLAELSAGATAELRSLAKTDPLGAGLFLADRLMGGMLEPRIADCRIGDFESDDNLSGCLTPSSPLRSDLERSIPLPFHTSSRSDQNVRDREPVSALYSSSVHFLFLHLGCPLHPATKE